MADRIGEVLDATEHALARVYGDQVPLHLSTRARWQDGGPDPLDGISIYRTPAGGWHYVGFGLSERAEKRSVVPEWSGWGFEPTFRVGPCAEPPGWPLELMNDVARYVFRSQKRLVHGHVLHRPGAPVGERLGLLRDRSLPDPVDTPNGRFDWLSIVMLTESELEALRRQDREAWLARKDSANPGWRIAPPNPV